MGKGIKGERFWGPDNGVTQGPLGHLQALEPPGFLIGYCLFSAFCLNKCPLLSFLNSMFASGKNLDT